MSNKDDKETLMEYTPGLTELRINVQGFIAMADKIIKDTLTMNQRIDSIESQNSDLIAENIDIKQKLQSIQAKLYEQGIR